MKFSLVWTTRTVQGLSGGLTIVAWRCVMLQGTLVMQDPCQGRNRGIRAETALNASFLADAGKIPAPFHGIG